MSEVRRYDAIDLHNQVRIAAEIPGAAYVLASDYNALVAERDRLRAELERLSFEYGRLILVCVVNIFFCQKALVVSRIST